MNRVAVRVCLLLIAALPMMYAVNWANRQGGDESPSPHILNRAAGFIVAADRFGAIIETRDGDLRGIRRDGTTAWVINRKVLKGPADPQVVCVGHCPAAAVAVIDESGSSSVTYWTGNFRKATIVHPAKGETGGPIWAQSTALSIERREDASFNTSIVFNAPSSNPLRVRLGRRVANVFVNEPGNRAVTLVTGSSGYTQRATAMWFKRGSQGWKRVGRAARGRWSNACVATSGRTLFAGDAVAIANFGSSHAIRSFVQTPMSECVADRAGFVVAGRDPRRRHTLSVTRITPTGRFEWRRRFLNAYPVSSAVTFGTSHVMAVADRTQTVLLAEDGSIAASFNNRLAPFVTPDGAVVTLDRKGKLRRL